MDRRQFPWFSRLPLDVQDKIWELSMTLSPCVQAAEIYGTVAPVYEPRIAKGRPGWFEELKIEFSEVGDQLAFLLPDQTLVMQSPYYHTVVAGAHTCQAAQNVFRRLGRQWGREEQAEVKALKSLQPNPRRIGWNWDIDKDRTITTIPVLQTPLTTKDKTGKVHPSLDLGTPGSFPVFLNPTSDILWLDLAWDERLESKSWYGLPPLNCVAFTLKNSGFYNRHLIALQRLAVEFVPTKFQKVCNECDKLARTWDQYKEWLSEF